MAQASMGPRLLQRGSLEAGKPMDLSEELASMGPRLLQRGSTDDPLGIVALDALLQWGRACYSAEAPGFGETPDLEAEWLQWGRACYSAEA